MGPLDRGILIIYTLTITLVLGLVVAFGIGWHGPLIAISHEALLPANQQIIWILLVIYILMGLWLLIKGLKVERAHKKSVVHEQGLGQVRVALPAVESLAEKVVSARPEVKDVKAKVQSVPKGVNIILQLVVAPDVNIPSLSGDLQKQVQDHIYNVVGITVHQVQIAVDKFHISKTRVE